MANVRNPKDLKTHPVSLAIYGDEPVDSQLQESIAARGVLVPLTIKADGTIISGHRRRKAAIACNLQAVPVVVVSFANELDERLAIIDHNRQRQKTVSQRMREAEELEAIERERAKGRQATSGPGVYGGKPLPAMLREAVSEGLKGETGDKAAKAAGMKRRTYDKAKAVYEAAKAGNAKAVEMLAKVDSGDASINKAYKDIRCEERKKSRRSAGVVPLPVGEFDLIYADPPWQYDFSETVEREIENQYPTMTVDEICGLEVPSADKAVLFLWATAPKLLEALRVMKAWGFVYKTHAIWDKQIIGMGYWFRGQHELLLVGTKGGFSPPLPAFRHSSVFSVRRGEHSAKPEEVAVCLEGMFPGARRLEMFARVDRVGWVTWGDHTGGEHR